MHSPVPVLMKKTIPPVDNYRKHIAQRFITRREADIPTLTGNEFIVSVKVDGAFSGYYYNKSSHHSFFFNIPQHRVYIGLPVSKDIEDLLQRHDINEILLVGELFASTHQPIDFTKRSRIYELAHYRRNPSSEDDLNRIGFQVFDVISIDGEEWIKKHTKDYDWGKIDVGDGIVVSDAVTIEGMRIMKKMREEGKPLPINWKELVGGFITLAMKRMERNAKMMRIADEEFEEGRMIAKFLEFGGSSPNNNR